jgi:Asp-tRNA(Asn)/Glu-tRNA(Gln) amidotransferase A subunit family amidase
MFADFSPTMRWIALKFLGLTNQGRKVTILDKLRMMEPDEFNALLKDRLRFTDEMCSLFQEKKLTAVISPFWPCPSPKIKDINGMGLLIEYSSIWNVTGFPAGTMPVTEVLSTEQFHTDKYNDSITKLIDSSSQDSEGLPVSIQVIGHPHEDEKVLGIMQQLEKKINYKIKMPVCLAGEKNGPK